MHFNREQLQEYIRFYPNQWRFLGQGTYNTVYLSNNQFSVEGISYDGYWVLKVPIEDDEDEFPLNTASRALKKSALLHEKGVFKAPYPVIQVENGLLEPYAGKQQPSDIQLAHKSIEIYQKTHNFVFDLLGEGNCFVYKDEVILVDYDLMCERGSPASDFYHKPEPAEDLDKVNYLYSYYRQKPISVAVTHGLRFLYNHSSKDVPIEANYLNIIFLQVLGVFVVANIILESPKIAWLHAFICSKVSYSEAAIALASATNISSDLPNIPKHDLLLHCIAQPDIQNPSILESFFICLAKEGVDINKKGIYGCNFLHLASYFEHYFLIRQFIAFGADVNQKMTALSDKVDTVTGYACSYRRHQLFELLIQYTNIPPITEGKTHWLHFAAREGLLDTFCHIIESCIKAVLKNTFQGENASASIFSIPRQQLRREMMCSKDYLGFSPLALAALNGHEVMVKYILEQGAHANINAPLPRKDVNRERLPHDNLLDILITKIYEGDIAKVQIARMLYNAGARSKFYNEKTAREILEAKPTQEQTTSNTDIASLGGAYCNRGSL